MVQPACYVLEQYEKFKHPLKFSNFYCNAVDKFIKDSNGNQLNQKACFRYSGCKERYPVKDFYVDVLKGSQENLPHEITAKDLLMVRSNHIKTLISEKRALLVRQVAEGEPQCDKGYCYHANIASNDSIHHVNHDMPVESNVEVLDDETINDMSLDDDHGNVINGVDYVETIQAIF
ncbi:hypothetical protein AYI70_g2013 [Smittium culicis]|uniref:Uncharacterized protein n=1 Tax=Smittium culicis TaxID=133412 RepID=A0A1R1YA32_9FUNG|nr:hypothetical protein AYI70_g2013 [Smittium culicis]